MPKRTVNFRDQLLEDLANPEAAALYLSAAVEDSEEMLLVALRDIAEAKQMAHVAKHAGVAREALYRMLSKSGNPTYSSLRGVLTALGIRMCFAPVETLAVAVGGRRRLAMQPERTSSGNRHSYIFVLITSTSSFTAAALLFSMACSSGVSLIW